MHDRDGRRQTGEDDGMEAGMQRGEYQVRSETMGDVRVRTVTTYNALCRQPRDGGRSEP
jgi:hypothetical protein